MLSSELFIFHHLQVIIFTCSVKHFNMHWTDWHKNVYTDDGFTFLDFSEMSWIGITFFRDIHVTIQSNFGEHHHQF